jgi:hypothetical protein
MQYNFELENFEKLIIGAIFCWRILLLNFKTNLSLCVAIECSSIELPPKFFIFCLSP